MMCVLMFFFLGFANVAGFFSNFMHGSWRMGRVEQLNLKPVSDKEIRVTVPTTGVLLYTPPDHLTFRWENGTQHDYRIAALGPVGVSDTYGPAYDWILLLNKWLDPFNMTRQ